MTNRRRADAARRRSAAPPNWTAWHPIFEQLITERAPSSFEVQSEVPLGKTRPQLEGPPRAVVAHRPGHGARVQELGPESSPRRAVSPARLRLPLRRAGPEGAGTGSSSGPGDGQGHPLAESRAPGIRSVPPSPNQRVRPPIAPDQGVALSIPSASVTLHVVQDLQLQRGFPHPACALTSELVERHPALDRPRFAFPDAFRRGTPPPQLTIHNSWL
jgi:hypothetical protein